MVELRPGPIVPEKLIRVTHLVTREQLANIWWFKSVYFDYYKQYSNKV